MLKSSTSNPRPWRVAPNFVDRLFSIPAPSHSHTHSHIEMKLNKESEENKRLWIGGGELLEYRERRGWRNKQARRRGIAWPWRMQLRVCGERMGPRRRWEHLCSGYGASSSPLSRSLLPSRLVAPRWRGGVGWMRLLCGRWMKFIYYLQWTIKHVITTRFWQIQIETVHARYSLYFWISYVYLVHYESEYFIVLVKCLYRSPNWVDYWA